MKNSIKDRKIRFGLVGCGRIAHNHFKALQHFSDDVELVALCDPNREQLQTATKETGAHGFEDFDDMLKSAELDIVSLCTPSGLHPTQAQQAAKAGVHVLTEKPMAIDFASGQKMVQVCEAAHVHLFVVQQNRFNATCQQVKKALSSGRFGKIYMITVNVFWSRPQAYYDLANWRGTKTMDGGAFMNQASHYVDITAWLMHEPVESVYAYTNKLARNIEMEDTGIALLKWATGAMGSINVTMLTYPENLEGSITILGEHGSAKIGGIALNKIELWKFADKKPADEDILSTSYQTESVYGHGHTDYYANVIDVLRGKAQPLSDGHEGLKTLEIISAIYQSNQTQKLVKLPPKEK